MMTEKQLIQWLLELQEHPERLTDEQMQQILADGELRQLVEQLGFTKRAFMNQELLSNVPPVDDEWEKFSLCHSAELDALDEARAPLQSASADAPSSGLRLPLRKMAASFIGLALVSGIALAAFQVARRSTRTAAEEVAAEATVPMDSPRPALHVAMAEDSVPAEQRIFDNTPLDTMLSEIAAAHGVSVEFQNEKARQLRFHFVWKRDDGLNRIVEKLNTFEAVDIVAENEKLIVR
ncbi:MAG: DUF4974 domain-containing protein [Prevotella sp.]|nr:DUF4974 domain-containing protein [Prevotella sp.]